MNPRLEGIYIRGQRRKLSWKRTPEYSCARKETAGIEILTASWNSGRNIMQPVRLLSSQEDKKT